MHKEIICAGFGGQGVLTAGRLIIYSAYLLELNSTWFPSYGNEMRGGTANCNVVIDSEKIASPYVKRPDVLLAMNHLAIDKFEGSVKSGGYLFVNSSLVDEDRKYREGINVVKVPVTEIAQKEGMEMAANICMLGAMINHTNLFTKEEFENAICKYFDEQGKSQFNEKNIAMFNIGYNYK